MNVSMKITNMTQLYTHIINIGQQQFTTIKHAIQVHTNINIILITIKAIWNTYIQKMKLRQQGDNTTDIKNKIIKFIKTSYNTELSLEIAQSFNHYSLLTKQARGRAHLNLPRISERQKILWPESKQSKLKFNNKYLSIINDTWAKTNLVTISPLGDQHSRMDIHLPTILIPWPP